MLHWKEICLSISQGVDLLNLMKEIKNFLEHPRQ